MHAAQGRPGDEATLRDALALTTPGGDPGPAGRVLVVWRVLAAGARLAAVAAISDAHAKSSAPAPVAAAAAASAVTAAFPRAASLAPAVGDLVLAARLGSRRALPLLAL